MTGADSGGGDAAGEAAPPFEVYVCCTLVMFFSFLRSFQGQRGCSVVLGISMGNRQVYPGRIKIVCFQYQVLSSLTR